MSPAQRAPVCPSTRTHRSLLEVDSAALRRRIPDHERCSRWGVYLLAVVHFQNFDVEVLPERLRHALDQRRKQIDAHAEIAGLDDHRAGGGRCDQLFSFAGQPGRADDVNAPILRGKLREGQGGRGNGEVHECIRSGEQRSDVGTDRNPVLADPTKLAGVAADHCRARRVHCTRERHSVDQRDGVNERAPHPSADPGDDQPHVGHRCPPQRRFVRSAGRQSPR